MTKHSKRRIFTTVVSAFTALFALTLSPSVQAQGAYPSRPITFIVPYPAGAASDMVARTIAHNLQKAWGQPVLVQNKPGAAGMIGANFVAKGPADGYTVLVSNTSLIQLPSMTKLPFDPLKDLAPVVQTIRIANLLMVPRNAPANSLDDFVKVAKAQPGKTNYGTWGAGSSAHIHGELLSQQTGAQLLAVPFQGSAPMMTALIGGQIDSGIADVASAKPHAKSVKILAVSGPERVAAFPDVPTFTELGYKSFEPRGWHGLFMPAGTPEALVSKMSVEVNRILNLPEVVSTIDTLGAIPGGGTPREFAEVMKSDAKTYAAIIKAANIRLD